MSRICANTACGASLEGMRASARYCSAACRTAGWKEREGITGYRAVKASQNGNAKASGLQVSYRKAVEVLHAELGLPKLAIESALAPALSQRQRQILYQREAA